MSIVAHPEHLMNLASRSVSLRKDAFVEELYTVFTAVNK
jgi:hypothetical protein